MSWGRTHNTIYPVGNNNRTVTTSEPFNKKGNALPPIDCCKELELQIKDIYKRICDIQETPITVIDTTSINLTVSGVNNHTLSANVIINPSVYNLLSLTSQGLFVDGSGSVLGANNGLTLVAGIVKLGGTLIQNTSIDRTSFTFDVSGTTGGLFSLGLTSSSLGVISGGIPTKITVTNDLVALSNNGVDFAQFSTTILQSTAVANSDPNSFLQADSAGVITNVAIPAQEEDKIYYGTDFVTSTDLVDATLDGKTYRLFWRGLASFVIPTVEWDYLAGGGFTILLSGFNVDPSDIFFVQFY